MKKQKRKLTYVLKHTWTCDDDGGEPLHCVCVCGRWWWQLVIHFGGGSGSPICK